MSAADIRCAGCKAREDDLRRRLKEIDSIIKQSRTKLSFVAMNMTREDMDKIETLAKVDKDGRPTKT